MGISRDSRHKRRNTGGKRVLHVKKRKFELGRAMANTRIGAKRVHEVRTMGGNRKYRALRLDTGNFSWGSEVCTRKTRILDVVYNASNNELVRTKTLVKSAIVLVDAAPFRAWYKTHYGVELNKRAAAKKKDGEDEADKKKSNHVLRRMEKNCKTRTLEQPLADLFANGRLLACISSRPGQCGRADGYILEGPELAFYQRKLRNYDVNVLTKYFNNIGFDVRWFDKRKGMKGLPLSEADLLGIIMNVEKLRLNGFLGKSRHWFAIRCVGTRWYNFDSKLNVPEELGGEKEVRDFIADLLSADRDNHAMLIIKKKETKT
eukprot:g6284.t1